MNLKFQPVFLGLFLITSPLISTLSHGGFNDPSGAPTVSLAKNVIREPADDLLDEQGNPLGAGEAASLAANGIDISNFNPQENKLWQNRSYPIDDGKSAYFPAQGATLNFVREEARNLHTYMAQVQNSRDSKKFYRFTLSRYTNATMLRAALLRKLGYYIPTPRLYRNITVKFPSLDSMNNFLTRSQEAVTADFENRKWILHKNDAKLTVTFSHAVLEFATPYYFDIHWAFMPNPDHPQQESTVRQFMKFRAFRALIVPLGLVDIPESINRFNAKSVSLTADSIVFAHPSARTFRDTTYEDALWLTRRMAKLSAQDWKEIVGVSGLPAQLEPLVYAKLISRIKNLFDLFQISGEANLGTPDLTYSSPDGVVQNGKVTKEFIDGYPYRFAHGDRENPFDSSDIARYLYIQGISSGIGEFLSKVNDELVVHGIEYYAKKHQQDLQQQVINHIKTKPLEPLYKKVQAWGGPIANATFSASRSVSTGTYYDSSAPVQLVDDFTVSASLGNFRAIDGLKTTFVPFVGANLNYVRQYIHVRPVTSMKVATKQSWMDLLVGPMMTDLAKVLDRDPNAPTSTPEIQHPLDEFLGHMLPGEVFTISDSIATTAYLQVASPLDALFGLEAFDFTNSLSFGADAGRVVLRQTSFTKTEGGFQVFVRTLNTNHADLIFDVDYFLKLLSFRASALGTKIDTKAYILDYNSEIGSLADGSGDSGKKVLEKKQRMQAALRALFQSNDPELFSSFFKHRRFDLQHKLNTNLWRGKLLMMRMNGFKESHQLNIRYPSPENYPDETNDNEVELFSYQRGQLIGRDLMGSLMDIFEALIEKAGLISRTEDPNPANTPYGNAYWRMVNTEIDLTKSGKTYPSVNIVEHTWGGWHLSRKDFLQIIDDINKRFADVSKTRLIEKEAFANSNSLDFYRIAAVVSIHENGLEKIRDLVLQPQMKESSESSKSMNIFSRFFQWLSEIGGKRLDSDIAFFRAVIKILGKGNEEQGHALYIQKCQEEQRNRNNGEYSGSYPGAWSRGSYYECLSSWMEELLALRREFPKDKKRQAEWYTNIMYVLEENIPLPILLNEIGKENYIFSVRINGFRENDEDGDLSFFSNSAGDPSKDFEVLNGLFDLYSKETGISPSEIKRTNGAYR